MSASADIQAHRQRLERALERLAVLVTEDTAFLPVFQRLEAELEKLDQRRDALDRAKALAGRAAHRAMR